MDERTIQHEYVMQYLCRREDEGGLGYKQTSVNLVNNDLFIPSDLTDFIKKSVPQVWKTLLKKYNHDEKTLESALMKEIKSRILDFQNVAIFINKNNTITFEGEKIPLFFVSGTELKGDEDFNQNIFSAVEEVTHKFEVSGQKIAPNVRPDISFFVNGIFFGYMELKTISQGQNAQEHGRQKIAKDYLTTIRGLVEQGKVIPSVLNERKAIMSMFEKAIHLTTSDVNDTFVLRGISQFYDSVQSEYASDKTPNDDELAKNIIDIFKPYPVSSLALSEKERFEEVMAALYGKKRVEDEIRYFNFIEYRYANKDGQKERTSNTGRLIAPRPKQKFGADKIMSRIREMLDNEKDPDYYINKLRKELIALGIPQTKIEEIILQRKQYRNNRNVYSLLMQYAAGFGKSNIIGWTALRLKDYRYEGKYAYDKIMLVVDRLQLRDQLDTTMMNMNIDKSMFVEAVDKATFISALESQKRIIVINIQKFLDMQEAINESGTKLKEMRVAFLIDEIHRSNSGDTHDELITLFTRLKETFSQDGKEITKKNLLIGFTATPSDETLTRFGEFRSAYTIPLWVPFDSYTMKEAIADGYILDPTKHILPYAVPVEFEIPEDLIDSGEDEDIKIKERKTDVYSFEPRMRHIAQLVVDRIVNLVYGKIHGQGKAMFAVSSIPNAIKYVEIIRGLYEKKCKEPMYSKYNDAPICIVYSDSQKYTASSVLNGGKSENKVIQDFKQAKNGLIIVVDKLQTGFDEPKLQTLFLDKEISDINAIQTISRVNRTCKYKNECHVVDCSWKNINIENINKAFRKYCDMVISEYNPEEEAKWVAKKYRELCSSFPYKGWFARYQNERNDAQFILEMEGELTKWVKQCVAEELAAIAFNKEHGLKPGDQEYKEEINPARDLRILVGHYGAAVTSLRDIYVIDKKYMDEIFMEFWRKYCSIYRNATKKEGDKGYVYGVLESDEVPGFTLIEDDGKDDTPGGKKGPKDGPSKLPSTKGKSMEQVIEILDRLNAEEHMTAMQAKIWLEEIGKMFQFIAEQKGVKALLLDDKVSDEDKLEKYKKHQQAYSRRLKKRTDFVQCDRFRSMLEDNVEQLFGIFIKDLIKANNNFDYTVDTPDNPEEEFTKERLIELAMERIKPKYDEKALKCAITSKFATRFECIKQYLPEFDTVVDGLFTIVNTPSDSQYDGLADGVRESMNMLIRAEGLSVTDKRIYLDTLLMRYEVFLKKLYFMLNKRKLENHDDPTQGPTLANAIFAIYSLRSLKYSKDTGLRTLSSELEIIRQLRNHEAHNAIDDIPENQIDAAVNAVMDIYLYSVGSNVENLKKAGVKIISDKAEEVIHPKTIYKIDDQEESERVIYFENQFETGNNSYLMVAESVSAKDLPEEQRIEIFKKSLGQLIGYNPSKSPFTKQRHWIAIYRIAADRGFTIENDYAYFMHIMNIIGRDTLPAVDVSFLEKKITGVYAQNISDWSADGLLESKLAEYADVKQCADAFLKIVESNIKEKLAK